MKEAIVLNKDVEHKVAKAAGDLHQVNAELAQELAERVDLESELTAMKTDLDEVRDDLSKSQAKEEETRKFALQDALTGLPNRVSFEQSLEDGLMQAKRHGWKLAVLFIDIDDFKSINDTYGHGMGDQALIMVADRLQSAVREEDTVSRWAGDEFVCLLLEVKKEADVTRIAENMVKRISESFEFDGTVLSLKVSIGIAIYPADGKTTHTLFKNADTAMYKAKGTEKRVVLFRDPNPL
jgi:diguanylate cyclase